VAAVAAILPLLSGFLLDGLLIRLATALPFFCLMEIVANPNEQSRLNGNVECETRLEQIEKLR